MSTDDLPRYPTCTVRDWADLDARGLIDRGMRRAAARRIGGLQRCLGDDGNAPPAMLRPGLTATDWARLPRDERARVLGDRVRGEVLTDALRHAESGRATA